jgi:hypothetical protein
MIVFQDEPDPVFLSIVDEALAHVQEVHLLRYRRGYRPTSAERRELEESYREVFPELVPLFTRRELVRVIDRLQRASRDERPRDELTDYHWLVLIRRYILFHGKRHPPRWVPPKSRASSALWPSRARWPRPPRTRR